MTGQTTSERIATTLCYTARIITLIWAGWWMFFGLAAGIGEGIGILGTLAHVALPGLIFLATAIIAWRWKKVGSVLLVIMGLVICISYLTDISMLLTMGMPPLAAGGLLVICVWISS